MSLTIKQSIGQNVKSAILKAGLVVALCVAPIGAAQTALAESMPPSFKGSTSEFTLSQPNLSAPELSFTDASSEKQTLADYKGQLILLNLWATWCPPCVKEMPGLDRLQQKYQGRLAVLPLSMDRHGASTVINFYAANGIEMLPVLTLPAAHAMKQIKPQGLPVTLLIAPDGTEIGRLNGEAEWDSPEAEALIDYYLSAAQ